METQYNRLKVGDKVHVFDFDILKSNGFKEGYFYGGDTKDNQSAGVISIDEYSTHSYEAADGNYITARTITVRFEDGQQYTMLESEFSEFFLDVSIINAELEKDYNKWKF